MIGDEKHHKFLWLGWECFKLCLLLIPNLVFTSSLQLTCEIIQFEEFWCVCMTSEFKMGQVKLYSTCLKGQIGLMGKCLATMFIQVLKKLVFKQI